MIFLKGLNILFLKPEKVAGTSFEIALSKYAGKNDTITKINFKDEAIRAKLGHRGPQNHLKSVYEYDRADLLRVLNGKSALPKFTQHMTAIEIEDALGQKAFKGAFKVSIVRHPLDRIISHFHWRNKTEKEEPNFSNWLRENPEILNFNDRFYFLRGEDVIDYYIRYENMFEDLKGLVEKRPALAGLPDLMKGIRSKDGIRPKERDFSSYIGDDEELVSCIKFFNRYHISKFGYFDLL